MIIVNFNEELIKKPTSIIIVNFNEELTENSLHYTYC